MSSSVEELREQLSNTGEQKKLAELLAMVTFLNRCVIDRTYRISDDWVRPLKFTALGHKVLDEFRASRPSIKVNDAALALFLQFGHSEGLLVSLDSDYEALRRKLSEELLRKNILLPYVFGRELHDKAAKLFPERIHFDYRKTIKILKELPIGVFQAGDTVSGPFGCAESEQSRSLTPSLNVPGYLCDRESCHDIHTLTLNTGDSSIAKCRSHLSAFLSKNYSGGGDRFVSVVRDAQYRYFVRHQFFDYEDLVNVLSDGLSEKELRDVADILLRKRLATQGWRNELSKRLNAVIASPTDFVMSLDRAHLLQLLLVHTDRDIVSSVDEAVASGRVGLKEFEVRTSRLRRWRRASSPAVEIGSLGVRPVAAIQKGTLAMRLLKLLHETYFESEDVSPEDLAYALEIETSLTDGELLQETIRTFSPEEMVDKLVVSNRRVARRAAEKLGIDTAQNPSRESLQRQLLWKLGVARSVSFNELDRLERHKSEVENCVGKAESEEIIRGNLINMFAALEGALRRALNFSIWALTTDHMTADAGFSYDPALNSKVTEFIETRMPASGHELRLRVDGQNDITALSAGFARLAKVLRKLDSSEFVRSPLQIPPVCEAAGRPFEFPYQVPFFDLAESSRSEILNALQGVAQLIQGESVTTVRNATAHDKGEFPSAERILTCCNSLMTFSELLKESGLFPQVYVLSNTLVDEFGRAFYTYKCSGKERTFQNPHWSVAPRMPVNPLTVVVLNKATTASRGPLRFNIRKHSGEDPYWQGWPKRWHTRSDYPSFSGGTDVSGANDVGGENQQPA
ncbi:hypothetical protein [Kineosporia babensis]|uniref:Uncharacterized protein n=1 Tax=Kineosporia babensis TaxID=499548 RepID=A0A9X1NQD9_9ACTN|nr:hypothetical protein [Kineosporia babensis]MCD5317268.1 hypothetical protein [Kineosporia babensis]